MLRILDGILRDVRDAGRAVVRSPAYIAWVIGSLAIGMAVAIAAFAFLIASIIGPFPEITDQSRLVRVNVSRKCGRPDCLIPMASSEDYSALGEGVTGLQGLTAYTQGEIAVGIPEARSMSGIFATANYFDVLGVPLSLGRAFRSADAETAAAVVVISHTVWTRDFAADPAILGRSIRVGNDFAEIIGVTPPLFIGIDHRPGGRSPDLWLPIWLVDRALPMTVAEQRRQERLFSFAGRLRDGIDVPTVQAETEVVARRLAIAKQQGAEGSATVVQVYMSNPKNWRFAIIVIMPIPILVLVIACVNATNLMLARGLRRQREIAIRLAIGSGRGRIIRGLLIESGLLALIATALATALAWWALEIASTPLGIPVRIDTVVLALTILTAAGTTIAFGLMPAARVSAQSPSTALGAGSPDAAPRESRVRQLLVVAQLALSVALLMTAWQLVSTVRAQSVSGGTSADELLVARFNLRPLNMAPTAAEGFYTSLLDGVRSVPGVETAGVARHFAVWTFGERSAPSLRVWEATDRPEDGRTTMGGYAGGDLFKAVGMRVIAGRDFTDADRRVSPQVALVNQSFAQAMKRSAVGSLLRVAPRNGDLESSTEVRIVGVLESVYEPKLSEDGAAPPEVFLPSAIEPEPALALYVRTRGSIGGVVQPVRELVARLAPQVPILEMGSLRDFNERSFAPQLWLARGAALLGVVGLILATAGLYGVSSYVVATKRREIAIRIAVGAAPRIILTMVLRQAIGWAAIGLMVGGAIAVGASRVIQSEYHGITGLDALAFGAAAMLFLATILMASAVPATRASRIDPIEELKHA